MPLVAVAVLAVALAVGGGRDAAAPHFQVLAHVNPGGGYSGDVVGHRGHAYLSSHRGRRGCPARGVVVYDLSSPSRPRLVSRFADRASEPVLVDTWTEKTIVAHVQTPRFSGELAVTSIQACSPTSFRGFALYDVTDPRRPSRLALVRTGLRGSHEIWLKPVGNRAYVYTAIIASELITSRDGGPGDPDFRIYDVTDPTRPDQVGSWGAWKELGIHPARGLGAANSARGNFVHSVITNRAGTRAYLSYWDLGTVILDVRRPSAPRYLGRTRVPPGTDGNAHSAALDGSERLLVQTHETSRGIPTLWDVSNAQRPRLLSAFRLPKSVLAAAHRRGAALETATVDLNDSVHDAKIAGRRAYFSWYNQGVVLADVSNPRRPRVLARFLPPPVRDTDGLACEGRSCTVVLGVDVEPGYVLASDLISGLWVLRVRD